MGKKAIAIPLLLVAAASGAWAARQRAADDDGAAGLAKALAGLTPGKPTSCMPLTGSNGQITAYGPAIVYTYTRSLKYVTKTNGGCEGIARGDILVTRQYQSRPCSGDIATTIDSASRFPTGSCALGDFVEYRK